MKKGFSKRDQKQLEALLGNIDSAIDHAIDFLREKHDVGEEWMLDRSEKWQESEACEEFEDWLSEIDAKIDELEDLRSEFEVENFDEIM